MNIVHPRATTSPGGAPAGRWGEVLRNSTGQACGRGCESRPVG